MRTQQFETVMYAVSPRIRRVLSGLNPEIKEKVQEIRLRARKPIALTIMGKTLFINENSQISPFITNNAVTLTETELSDSFKLLCHSSVYAHEDEINEGYIMMDGGHRAGICGTMTQSGMRDITSLNIRIAREVLGCATDIAQRFDGGGVLIAGPPGSGKTTLLRDLVRQLSRGFERHLRVCVIDSRGEISGGRLCNDLGPNTDVLFSKDKAKGTQMALRTMFPDVIAFDEVGTIRELDSIRDSFNAGVAILTTAHIGTPTDILRRSVTRELLTSGAVSYVVVLNRNVGSRYKIFSVQEVLNGGCN